MSFYTNVVTHGNRVLYRGYKNGNRMHESVDYLPTLFVSTSEETKYKTLDGKCVEPFRPGSIKDCKNFIEDYKDVSGFSIHGNSDFVYQFIGDLFPEEIEYDPPTVRIAYLDIETTCEKGFPNVDNPVEKVIGITLRMNGKSTCYGLGEFTINEEDVVCKRYDNEESLLSDFIQEWRTLDPDIVTGWNVKFFDVAYLYTRIREIMGEKVARKLSPWGSIREHRVHTTHGVRNAYELVGIATLDYLDLYKTFTYVNQESYKLDHIVFVELGERKVAHDEYDSMIDFYTKDFQKFMEYNFKDTLLIEKLESKMKLMELALALAYTAKVNFVDVFSQVRTWDQIIYHHLRTNNIVIPLKKRSKSNDVQIVGAYVKEPIAGKHDWVVSFDLNSLYPHLIMHYNISPETKMNVDSSSTLIINPDNILKKTGNWIKAHKKIEELKSKGYAVAANGTCYRKDIEGFLPKLMRKMYDERKLYKKKMIAAQKKKEKNPTDKTLDFEIIKYHNFQLVRKIQLNSAYGAIANQYFRYYDREMGEAITCSGQLAIQWIANKLNEFLNKTLKTDDYDYVVASDTDSVYLRLGNLVERTLPNEENKEKIVCFLDKSANEIILPFIKKQFSELADMMNAYENKMVMEREVIADKGIWTAKKRYMLNVYDSEGVRYSSPKLKIMGIETTRSSTPNIVRSKLKNAIKIIMTGTEDQLIDFVSLFKKEFNGLGISDIAFPRSCNNLNEYRDPVTVWRKSTPIAVKGALVYNHLLKKWNLESKYLPIQEGDKIKFVSLKNENPYGCNVISFPGIIPKEFELEKYVDKNKQFSTSFLEPLGAILQHIGWYYERRNVLFQ